MKPLSLLRIKYKRYRLLLSRKVFPELRLLIILGQLRNRLQGECPDARAACLLCNESGAKEGVGDFKLAGVQMDAHDVIERKASKWPVGEFKLSAVD